jgi:hypothetical protein
MPHKSNKISFEIFPNRIDQVEGRTSVLKDHIYKLSHSDHRREENKQLLTEYTRPI